jgi:hypothetical protein
MSKSQLNNQKSKFIKKSIRDLKKSKRKLNKKIEVFLKSSIPLKDE